MIYAKTLFGLLIESEFDLPGFAPTSGSEEAQITIRRGTIDPDALEGLVRVGPVAHAAPGLCIQAIPQVAQFAIRSGQEIIVDPDPAVEFTTLNTFILGSPLGVALLQRGVLILHGNAIVIEGQAIVCVGDSGAGKSTLAKTMLDRGYDVFADDLSVIDPDQNVLPGIPRIKLWQNSIEKLGVNDEDIEAVKPDMPKFLISIGDDAERKPTPIHSVIHLSTHSGANIVVNRLNGLSRFQMLRRNVFRRHFIKQLDLWPRLVPQIGTLATSARMFRIQRPDTGFDIDGLVDAILSIRSMKD